ncbi:Two pore calcium channel protein 1 [Cyphomyrmex costatus]|uniref:Two pore calcium channel protein 1 n=1 Tax=Cyphomyrmex costatus TaxID=456900 RepID=A0A195CAN9_9HYME|nr:Two pore calcium channel protein 1 [Cyphomyrmex costatus]
MNYQEAAIFLEEGINNITFDSHPSCPKDLPTYLLVHNRLYNLVEFSISLVLLSLAFVEEPTMYKVPIWIHGWTELSALLIVGCQMILKMRSIGCSISMTHIRTVIKGIILVVMFCEITTILVRQSLHIRVTRALRPIFLIDTKYCGGVRRFIRKVFLTVNSVSEMICLLYFLIFIFALTGYCMFNKENTYFSELWLSYLNLFILLTTSNFPDVMLISYYYDKRSAIFFIVYLCTMLYVIMNLMLALANETFASYERDKFKKLFLHKMKACKYAFKLLVSNKFPGRIEFPQFKGLMLHYDPSKSTRDIVLMFCHMNKSKSGSLNYKEFLSFYDANTLKWSFQHSNEYWRRTFIFVQPLSKLANVIIKWRYFEALVYMIIIGDGISIVIRSLQIDINSEAPLKTFCSGWDAIFFRNLMMIETIIKILALATYLVFFRPLRTLRLFKLKKIYRDIFGTIVILFPQMCLTAVVILILYYFYAIIGMELFAGYDLRDCCRNTTIEYYYAYSYERCESSAIYYVNTFNHLMDSCITLFELTVLNNWHVQMYAYGAVNNQLDDLLISILYFCTFIMTTMLVLTFVVSSFLEAFRFRMQYKNSICCKHDEKKMFCDKVELIWHELQFIIDHKTVKQLHRSLFINEDCYSTSFIGSLPRTREVLQKKMYREEINKWIAESESEFEEKMIHNTKDRTGDGISNTDHLVLNGNLCHWQNANLLGKIDDVT